MDATNSTQVGSHIAVGIALIQAPLTRAASGMIFLCIFGKQSLHARAEAGGLLQKRTW